MTNTAKPARHDIWQLADHLQMDLRAAQAKLVELRSMLASLELPDTGKTLCPHCSVQLKGQRTLAEHLYTAHDGPLPDHWAAVDEQTDNPTEELDLA